MSVEIVTRKDGARRYRVRWREAGRNRARTFDRKRDADLFDADVRRRSQAGTLAMLDAGTETLDEYVAATWTPTYAPDLAPRTRQLYADLYDRHVSPHLGTVRLRDLNPELIARWQADRLTAGVGRESVRKAFTLLGGILQRAAEAQRIPSNPQRHVRKAAPADRQEVRPLAPTSIERMRAALGARDATLISVLAYGGLRPEEALALRWGDVRERTILVERAVALGEFRETKTRHHRTVRLLAPLRVDLAAWRLASGRPADDALVFPGNNGAPWTLAAYQSWRRRAFARALKAADISRARPYDLRHSFASLLLAEGRNVIYVARQLGHGAQLTTGTYGHVIDELEDTATIDAEAEIRAARETPVPASYPRTLAEA